MSINDARARITIVCAAVAFTATGIAVIALPSGAPAESMKTVLDTEIGGNCQQGCPRSNDGFSTLGNKQRIAVTSPGTYGCSRSVVEISVDGQYVATRRVGPGWEQPPLDVNLAPGDHSISTLFQSLADCREGQPDGFKGRLQIFEVLDTPSAPPTTPKVAKPMATVIDEDVDVYERPNINNDQVPLGILKQGKQVEVVQGESAGSPCTVNSWCKVRGPDVPTGQGFIWGHLQLP